ncbi:MAG: phosphonate C-P lyase system protein PhnG [Tabrizicola sp.]|uniref:phosphonate C-P lyase system protein PhnG n=1 Tax=Tabrizicola sp. TaxID=2005166 RepID=UPI001B5040D4|nr:phosphonate C-P lyase system protein PhnG [Tabrizicola sp.]MCC6518694.1 phosphonate C-P lyase system protein PhnG [Tabrizicola sp.]
MQMTQASPLSRKTWMATLAKAAPARLAALFPDLPPHAVLRQPEIGAVMVRGRVGGTGVPFNLGEMTVTRASVRLASGEVGHAWVQGRDKLHALRAAAVDALMQTDRADGLTAQVLRPLEVDARTHREIRAAKAAGTKVDFFTMVRGEDK